VFGDKSKYAATYGENALIIYNITENTEAFRIKGIHIERTDSNNPEHRWESDRVIVVVMKLGGNAYIVGIVGERHSILDASKESTNYKDMYNYEDIQYILGGMCMRQFEQVGFQHIGIYDRAFLIIQGKSIEIAQFKIVTMGKIIIDEIIERYRPGEGGRLKRRVLSTPECIDIMQASNWEITKDRIEKIPTLNLSQVGLIRGMQVCEQDIGMHGYIELCNNDGTVRKTGRAKLECLSMIPGLRCPELWFGFQPCHIFWDD
jgi:hypothetical protein